MATIEPNLWVFYEITAKALDANKTAREQFFAQLRAEIEGLSEGTESQIKIAFIQLENWSSDTVQSLMRSKKEKKSIKVANHQNNVIPKAVYITFETLGDLKTTKRLIESNEKNLASKILLTRLNLQTCPTPGSIHW